MSDSQYIHETIIKDIVDMALEFPEKGVDYLPGAFKTNGYNSYKSIAAGSDKLTLVFPVFTSSSVSIDSAMIISKAIERKCATMMQMLFSAINISDAKDAFEYINKFHGNLQSSDITVDNFIDTIDKYAAEHESANIIIKPEVYNKVKEDLKNINYVLPTDINEASLNDYVVQNRYGEIILSEAKATTDDLKRAEIRSNSRKQNAEYYNKQLIATDVNKANELVPTMMMVRFINPDSGVESVSVVGIKAKLYIIDSNDIIDRLMLKNKDNDGLTKFIRATTREISFWKDFVFAIDKAKIDALSSGRHGSSSKIWKILERRAKIGNLKRFFGMNNDAAAISTLVISKEDVESLKKEYDIDVEKANIIRPIMESYSLMGFVIVDESIEAAKFIFDTGDDNYENLSFKYLEKESSGNDYKKIINLMSKMSPNR